MTDNEPIKDN